MFFFSLNLETSEEVAFKNHVSEVASRDDARGGEVSGGEAAVGKLTLDQPLDFNIFFWVSIRSCYLYNFIHILYIFYTYFIHILYIFIQFYTYTKSLAFFFNPELVIQRTRVLAFRALFK